MKFNDNTSTTIAFWIGVIIFLPAFLFLARMWFHAMKFLLTASF